MRTIFGVLVVLLMVLVALFATIALMGEQARAPDMVMVTNDNVSNFAQIPLTTPCFQFVAITNGADRLTAQITLRSRPNTELLLGTGAAHHDNAVKINNYIAMKNTPFTTSVLCLEVTTTLKHPYGRTPNYMTGILTGHRHDLLLLTAERRRTTWEI